MVTLFIGSERRAFQVHLQRLGPLVARFEQKPEGEIHMPQWDADVFNLVVNWAYNTSLPRIGNLTKWFDPNRPHPDLSLPNTDQFIPFVKSGDTDGAVDHYATITTQPRYQRFSIEELRLHFAEIQNSGDEIIRHPSNHSESEQARSEDGKAEEYHCTPSRLTIPCCIPDEEAAKAERGQICESTLAVFFLLFLDSGYHVLESVACSSSTSYFYQNQSLILDLQCSSNSRSFLKRINGNHCSTMLWMRSGMARRNCAASMLQLFTST